MMRKKTGAGGKKEDCRQIELYEAVLNHLDVGVHVIDRKGRTMVYNSVMGKLESEEPEDMIGRLLTESLPYLNPEQSTMLTVLNSGEAIRDRQQTYINAHGKQVVTVNTTIPVYVGGELFGALEIAKDVTYIQMLAEQIADLRSNLQSNLQKNKEMPQKKTGIRYSFDDIVGESLALREAVEQARRVARTSSSVLICGETGTGKEVMAQSIHQACERKGDFVAVNCAALPEQLLEGMLFGTAKGGFTGAVDRPGLFEQAQGGTLLLDEVNSMPLELQAKLLRVIQERFVRRVGGTKEIPVDVRVLATMNMDPFEAMRQKMLREDLYYRLGVVTLLLPPLRERRNDLALYVQHFIQRSNEKMGKRVRGVSEEVAAAFQRHEWPGNVREVAHVMEGSMNMMGDEERIIEKWHLPIFLRSLLFGNENEPLVSNEKEPVPGQPEQGLQAAKATMEKDRIAAALRENGGNITMAAAALGVTRQALQYKMRKHGFR